MPEISEFELQRSFIWWLNGNHEKNIPRGLIPGPVAWHVPNGGLRGDFEGKRFKEMGVLPGNPDVHINWGRLYLIELKKLGKGLSQAQRDLHPLLRASGAEVATADNLRDAKLICWRWGLVTPESMRGVDSQPIVC